MSFICIIHLYRYFTFCRVSFIDFIAFYEINIKFMTRFYFIYQISRWHGWILHGIFQKSVEAVNNRDTTKMEKQKCSHYEDTSIRRILFNWPKFARFC